MFKVQYPPSRSTNKLLPVHQIQTFSYDGSFKFFIFLLCPKNGLCLQTVKHRTSLLGYIAVWFLPILFTLSCFATLDTSSEQYPICVPRLFSIWDCYWGHASQLMANFFPLSLKTIPGVCAKVISAQLPSPSKEVNCCIGILLFLITGPRVGFDRVCSQK